MSSTLLGGADTAAPEASSPDTPTASSATPGDATQAAPTAQEQTEASAESADGTQGQPNATANDAASETEATEEAAPDYSGLEIPDGSPLDASLLESAAAFAGEHGLTPEQAQAIIDRDSQRAVEGAEAWVTQVNAWEQQVRSDPDLGGDKLAATVQAGKAALAAYFSPEFAAELNQSGMGNHPEFIRGLAKIHARHLAEPTQFARGGQPASSDERTRAFPNSPDLYGEGQSATATT